MTTTKPYDIDILKRIEDSLLDDTRIDDNRVNVKFTKKQSDVRSFFENKCILITGATGFLGKVTVEKLLRCCPEIQTIFLLIREKKGKSIEKRLEEIFSDPIYEVLKKEQPKFRNKIHAIRGDMTLPRLDITYENLKLIIERVSIIIHSAATVKFNEKLNIAIKINVCGTKELLEIAHQCKNLKSFVHISTAYSHCVRTEIDEKFYDPPITGDAVLNLLQNTPENEIVKMTDSLIGEYPNTYTYTKCIAEDIVKKYGKNLPICVFRPSIVIATYREPVRGWTDNLYGTSGVLVGSGLGIIKTLCVDEDTIADLIPVDMVANAIICAAWIRAKDFKERPSQKDIPIYNYVSSCDKPTTWGEFMSLNGTYGLQVPSMHAIWYYSLTLNKNKYVDQIYRIFLHYLPAILYDAVSIVQFKKPKLLSLFNKIHEFSKSISYFSTRYWKFTNKNVNKMWEKMNPCDKRVFNFDVSQIDWDYHAQTHIAGIRVYLVKEDLSNLKEAKARWRRLKLIHEGTKVVAVLFLIFFALYFISSLINLLL